MSSTFAGAALAGGRFDSSSVSDSYSPLEDSCFFGYCFGYAFVMTFLGASSDDSYSPEDDSTGG